MSDYRYGLAPKGPDEWLGPPIGGMTPEEWRRLNTWKYRLWQMEVDPRSTEWFLSPREQARLAFVRWLKDTGRIDG